MSADYEKLFAEIASYAAHRRADDASRHHAPNGTYAAQVADFRLDVSQSASPEQVIRELIEIAEPGLAAITAPRFFGWVMGGSNPTGVAADWLREGGMERRVEVLAGLEALRAGRAGPVDTAQAWLGDEHAALRLRFAAEAALDLAARQLGARDGAGGLTGTGDFPKLSAWFDGVNRLREQLGAPLRHDLVLAGLLLDWRGLYESAGPGRASGRRAG